MTVQLRRSPTPLPIFDCRLPIGPTPKSNVQKQSPSLMTDQSAINNQQSTVSRGCSLAGVKRCTVDAEIASSSLVSPAKKSKGLSAKRQLLCSLRLALS